MTDVTDNNVTTLDENEIINLRKEKLALIKEKGVAYPNNFERTHVAACLHGEHDGKTKEELESLAVQVKIAGRILTRRVMGKASFITIQDMSGKIQAYLRKQDLPDGLYDEFKNYDLGDIVGIHGVLFKTKTNELSIKASFVQLMVKSLRPLPDKFHGMKDKELRYRQRYVDLIVNEETRNTFKVRSKLIHAVRDFLMLHKYMEVETPMMHPVLGGAAARPFTTHHNTLDMQLYLRIAPELYLKRLVVGGFERVFEINRNFRNEGLSTRHNPEFTMLEFYAAFQNYTDLMNLTEELFKYLGDNVIGKRELTYQGHTFNLDKKFTRLPFLQSILDKNKELDDKTIHDIAIIKKHAKDLGIKIESNWGKGKILTEIFEKTVEGNLLEPTFITEYPTEVSPLARQMDSNPEFTERFEFFVAGKEIANGFSELNDPNEQNLRFLEQVKAKASGDDEAMEYDEDYIRALEFGLPPTAGEGIGIDRLAMLFTDSPSIRDVILFPQLRKS